MKKARGDLIRYVDRWKGETVVCAASGPSITKEQLDLVKAKDARLIVINDTYRLAPWADCLFASDARWWEHHIEKVRADFAGEFWTMQEKAWSELGVLLAPAKYEKGLNLEPGWINHGTHSGFQAINLAYQFGAGKIILLGYDCRYVHHPDCNPDQQGKCRPHNICQRHWFGSHPKGWGDANHIDRWLEQYRTIKCDRPIINCSPGTAVDAFQKMPLDEALL